ncbi:MAG: hypothetical protein V3R96_05545 [Dehalococcoidales bacterium]
MMLVIGPVTSGDITRVGRETQEVDYATPASDSTGKSGADRAM